MKKKKLPRKLNQQHENSQFELKQCVFSLFCNCYFSTANWPLMTTTLWISCNYQHEMNELNANGTIENSLFLLYNKNVYFAPATMLEKLQIFLHHWQNFSLLLLTYQTRQADKNLFAIINIWVHEKSYHRPYGHTVYALSHIYMYHFKYARNSGNDNQHTETYYFLFSCKLLCDMVTM